ncbi:putative cytochrome P450 family protein [Sphaerosporella brunnea]|uniref:Putative cytochrome P450 family protein n=1 Tax=Sphaerosporella brunnea TaxID=1250544 RepID=A0A5J5EX07_9PEZI|nr:putative cytochrome P450 family protein [Sphaerosporella brunnea]
MMWPLVYQVLAVCIGIYALRILHQKIQNQRFARSHGCKPAGTNLDILGLYRFYELLASSLNQTIPLYGEALFSRQKRNTIQVVDLGRSNLVTCEPKNIQYILSNINEYGLGGARDNFHYLLGNGIFTADGEAWAQSRALVRPSFTWTQIADFESLEEHIHELFLAIEALEKDGVTEMKPLLHDLTMDFASEFLFGQTSHALKQRMEGATDGLAHAFDRGMVHLTLSWILGELHWLWRPSEYRKVRDAVHSYVDGFILKALEARSSKSSMLEAETEKERVLREGGRYVFLNALTTINQDPEMLRAQVLNIMLAGRDTTAALISWIMWVLAREPKIWQKLRQEVKSNLGAGKNARLPTWKVLKDMKYLQAVINETLRFYAVVPWSNRIALRNTILPVGGGPDQSSPIFVAKGAMVSYSLFSMHRRKDIWGEDAQVFSPDRWLRGDAGKKLREIGWGYLPFSGGPRICPGQQFALTEASYIVVRFCQRYKSIEKALGESDEPTWLSSAVAPPGDNIRVRLEKESNL